MLDKDRLLSEIEIHKELARIPVLSNKAPKYQYVVRYTDLLKAIRELEDGEPDEVGI